MARRASRAALPPGSGDDAEAGRVRRVRETSPAGAALILAASLVAATACGPAEASSRPAAEGQPATRVVSLMPATTGVLLALGAGDLLVGRTTADPAHPAMDSLLSVGRPLTPSVEALAALRPDLVVAYQGMDAAPLERALPGGGRLLRLDIQGIDDVRTAVDTLGALTGRRAEAAALARALDADLARAREIAATHPPVRVAWVVWPSAPPRVAGAGSFVGEILHLAGGRNVMRPGEGAWPQVAFETLLERDPDVVVWPRGGGIPGSDAVDGVWRTLPAVREGRVVRVEADSLHVPGPWIGRAAVGLARRLAEAAAGGEVRSADERAAGPSPRPPAASRIPLTPRNP